MPGPRRGPGTELERISRLLEEARAGDLLAFGELVQATERPLATMLRRMPNGPPPDLIGDVSAEAYQQCLSSLDQLEDPERFVAWLFVVARRRWFRMLRLEMRRPDRTSLNGDGRAEALDGEATAERETLDADELEALLALLPEEERRLLQRRYLVGRSREELAKEFGISENQVKHRLTTALRRARDLARLRWGRRDGRLDGRDEE